jgi:hypothetical protein
LTAVCRLTFKSQAQRPPETRQFTKEKPQLNPSYVERDGTLTGRKATKDVARTIDSAQLLTMCRDYSFLLRTAFAISGKRLSNAEYFSHNL